jgi:EpsD family peptidyl-prolyl cis-trans isomerase
MMQSPQYAARSTPRPVTGLAGRACCALVVSASLLAGCSSKDAAVPTQVVAKVSGEEITEIQVNQALERQPGLKPDQVEPLSRKVVAGLVEQEIVLQKARELKIDRDPRVVQNVEALKRETVARAYLDRIAEGAAKPTPAEQQVYYDANPALFKQRRVYTFQELSVQVSDAQKAAIEAQLSALKSPAELEAYLKAQNIPARSERSTVAAEGVPLALLQRIAGMKAGQGLILPAAGGLRIVLLLGAQDSPVSEEQARPAIGAYLLNQRKREVVEKELASLRTASKVEYFGKYADMAASAASPGAAASAAASAPDPVKTMKK